MRTKSVQFDESSQQALHRRGWCGNFRLIVLLVALACGSAPAQERRGAAPGEKLPPAEEVINDYLKAVGGKKRLRGLRSATYEWAFESQDGAGGRATTHIRRPDSARLDIKLGQGEINSAATRRSAWRRGPEGFAHTLTDATSKEARLLAALSAGRMLDYKKQNLSARTVGAEQAEGERGYVVEFKSPDGARLRLSFGASSKLLWRIADADGRTIARFGDYKIVNGIMEPHRAKIHADGAGDIVLRLQNVRHNAELGDALFDAPRGEVVDVAGLVREVLEREPLTNVKYGEYTFTVTHRERELDNRGEVTRETSYAWDIFLTPGGRSVGKLVSHNGRPLPAERAAKEDQRVAAALAEAEKEGPPTGRGGGGFSLDLGKYKLRLEDIIRACDLVAPRRERFLGREAVVFDFRPRADFRPKNKNEEILSKIVGVVWIDPGDKVLTRIEARLFDDFKVGGGLLMKIAPGAGFVFERMRLADGFWVPRFYHWNANGKGFVFLKRSVFETTEWSNYRRFQSEAGDAKLDAPKVP